MSRDLLVLSKDALKRCGLPPFVHAMPEIPEEAAVLRDKKILLIDNAPEVFEVFVPWLVAATDGNASFLFHVKEALAELAEKAVSLSPDIVLIDECLAGTIRGHTLTAEILERKPQIKVIGFSATEGTSDAFTAAGAAGFAEKDTENPEATLIRVAHAITSA